MNANLQEERQQAHALLDRLPPIQFGAVKTLLEAMVDEEPDDELTPADRMAIQRGIESLDRHGPVSMEEVLGDFGLTMTEFQDLCLADTKPNG